MLFLVSPGLVVSSSLPWPCARQAQSTFKDALDREMAEEMLGKLGVHVTMYESNTAWALSPQPQFYLIYSRANHTYIPTASTPD
eukprot:6202402-Pleurochrysis_carterae.AAC.1